MIRGRLGSLRTMFDQPCNVSARKGEKLSSRSRRVIHCPGALPRSVGERFRSFEDRARLQRSGCVMNLEMQMAPAAGSIPRIGDIRQ